MVGASLAGSQLALGSAGIFLGPSRNLAAITASQRDPGRCPAAVFARASATETPAFGYSQVAPRAAIVSKAGAVASKKNPVQTAAVGAASKTEVAGERGSPLLHAPSEERVSETGGSADAPDESGVMGCSSEGCAERFECPAESVALFAQAAVIGFVIGVEFAISGGDDDGLSVSGGSGKGAVTPSQRLTPEQGGAIRGLSARPALAQEETLRPVSDLEPSAQMRFPGADASSIRYIAKEAAEADRAIDAFAKGLAGSVAVLTAAGRGDRPRLISNKIFQELARMGSFKGGPSIADSEAFTETLDGAALDLEMGGRRIEAIFARHDGRLVFAGWREAGDRAFVAQPDVAREEAGRIEARFDGMRVMGLGQAGGESSFGKEPLEIDDPEVVERLLGLILAQLAAGPGSLAQGDMLRQFNAFVRARLSNGSSAPHTPEQWEAYLKEALVSAVRLSMPFDERGARSIEQIESDAARILGIDLVRVSEWEEHLGAEFISEQLFETAGSLSMEFDRSSPKARLAAEFTGSIESMAKRATGASPDPAVPFADEASVQWGVARAGMMEGITAKADQAAGLMRELRLSGKRGMASRALAIIFRSSDASEAGAREDGIVPRWSEAEVAAVVKRLMTDETWDVASHRSFRMHLTPAENAFANRLVEMANLHNVVDVVRSLDLASERDIDEVWEAIDSSGQGEAIMSMVVGKMTDILRLSPGIIDASMSEELN